MSSAGFNSWIGVDLDGTLAVYDTWKAWNIIGKPIPLMVERIRGWLAQGREVRIFTARVAFDSDVCKVTGREFTREDVIRAIQYWLVHEAKLPALLVTAVKDFQMAELWDDRCIQVIPNTGKTLADELKSQWLAEHGKP